MLLSGSAEDNRKAMEMLCRNCGRSWMDHGPANSMCPYDVTSPAPPSYWHPAGRHYETNLYDQIRTDDLAQTYAGIEIKPAIKRTINPKFHAALKKMAEVHDKKSQDYASDANRYSNFEEAAKVAGISVEQVFLALIGVKLARLKELSGNGKTPNNESVQDTRLDLANYATLLLSYYEV